MSLAKRGGNKRTVDERAVLNGVTCILSTGGQWAALPKNLPPRSTVNDYLRRWDEDRTLDRIQWCSRWVAKPNGCIGN
nr:transposase [Belnapia moabensis]